MTAPSPFSTHNPKLQLVWDSTSLHLLMFCPRRYQLWMIEGWRGSSVDLEFGLMFASAAETFKKARVEGKEKNEATMLAVKQVMEDSWIDSPEHCEICDQPNETCTYCILSGEPNGKPWGGHYDNLWRCTGTQPYKNAKGNRAKCPWSHKGVWNPSPAPDTCGECGSPTEIVRQYVPNHASKNRETLVRLVAWYCEEQPEDLTADWHALKFPDGKPAVELSWKLPLPFKNKSGEAYVLSGHFDSIMTDTQESFISDNKTTKASINQSYWAQFSPNVQVDTYDLAGSILFAPVNVRGVLIEAAQTLVGGAKFSSQVFYRTDAQREEFLKELEYWLGQAEYFAETNYWPMNRTNCKMCSFNGICSKDPTQRERYLQADFTKQKWNPLEER